MSSLVERDQKVVWHPYAPPAASPLFAVERASGVRLTLEDGREQAISEALDRPYRQRGTAAVPR